MKNNRQGFTLFELMIAMALLTFIVAMVFELLTSFLTTTDLVQTEQTRMDKIGALRSFLSYRLGTIPADTHLLSAVPDTLGGILLGTEKRYTVFNTVTQSNGLLELRMASYTAPQQSAFSNLQSPSMLENYRANKMNLTWTSLLKDIKSFQWRFFDRDTAKWSDTWTPLDHNPKVIELKLQLAGENASPVFDFPMIQLAPQPLFLSTPTVGNNVLPVQLPQNGASDHTTPTPAPNKP